MLFVLLFVIVLIIIIAVVQDQNEKEYATLESLALNKLGLKNWNVVPYYDEYIKVKSRQGLEKYDEIIFFRESGITLASAKNKIQAKQKIATTLRGFLQNNEFKQNAQYSRLEKQLYEALSNASSYRISVSYTTPSGNSITTKEIKITKETISKFEKDPTLLLTKAEYSKLLKDREKEALSQKHHQYYEKVNNIIDYASKKRESLIIKGSMEKVDSLISQLFDRTVNSIKKIKKIDSEEWEIIGIFISNIDIEINKIVEKNNRILQYYESPDFAKIKETCGILLNSQREFNEYITEKVESISRLFGTRVVRNETINDDEYQYIRPYQKTITPFTAEVSAAVFASAENSPIEYIVKNFYPNKELYPEQIQNLHLLLDELATLKDAKHIIENHKKEYEQYLINVPNYIMEEDESGFFSRLGFAHIDESVLIVEYKFSYTSGGGMAKRTFTIPMTEETIIELIKALENKLTIKAFSKEQRTLMTNRLREAIKNRDNHTCCNCGNSTYVEPNLLLEIDHIIPISKGGLTKEDNLQTLCWKCNRAKSNKLKY